MADIQIPRRLSDAEAHANYLEAIGGAAEETISEYECAQELMDAHTFRTLRDTLEILVYRNGKYVPQDIIEEAVEYRLGKRCRRHVVSEVIGHIERLTLTDRADFDSDPNILNLQNGLLNIKTMEFKPHTPKHLSLIQLQVAYDPKAKCPNVRQFLAQVLRPRDFFLVMEMVGYILLNDMRYEKSFMLVGSGSNGKGTLLRVIECLLGPENHSHQSLHALVNDRFAPAQLHGKMANLYADIPEKSLTETDMFKLLTSGDRISAQRKHQHPFDFNNRAKLIFSSNVLPKMNAGGEYAFYRRWIIIPFTRTFEADKDTALLDRLTTPEELSGLLNLALVALRYLLREGEFPPTSVRQIQQEYESHASTIKAFLEKCCKIDGISETLTRDVFARYCEFCKESGKAPEAFPVLGGELAKQGVVKKQLRKHGAREYYYLGISLS